MIIYTIGFTQKSAEQFFEKIRNAGVQIVIDIRLNNQSQLAGFAKGRDLEYFMKNLIGCKYAHEVMFAPTKTLLDDYKKGVKSWDQYVEVFEQLIESRDMVGRFTEKYGTYEKVLLLCSEPTPEQCHRRLLAEAIERNTGCQVIHI